MGLSTTPTHELLVTLRAKPVCHKDRLVIKHIQAQICPPYKQVCHKMRKGQAARPVCHTGDCPIGQYGSRQYRRIMPKREAARPPSKHRTVSAPHAKTVASTQRRSLPIRHVHSGTGQQSQNGIQNSMPNIILGLCPTPTIATRNKDPKQHAKHDS